MRNRNFGFTLIELLVVISIISIVSSIVLVNLNNTRDKGVMASGRQFAAHNMHAFGADAIGIWDFNVQPNGGSTNVTGFPDMSGNNRNLVPSGGSNLSVSQTTPTSMGYSFELKTSGSNRRYATTGNLPVPSLSVSTITASIWVYFTSTINVNNNLFIGAVGTGAVLTTSPILIYSDNDNLLHCNSALTGGAQEVTFSGIQLNRWHHVACSASTTGKISVFIDGKLVPINPSLPLASGSNKDMAMIKIGASGNTFIGNPNASGFVDDATIYPYTLFATDIQRIYAQGAQERGLAIAE